jgi:nucleotide-binding universal stress UspA family protein
MTLRHILVPLQGTADDTAALSSALGIAKSVGAHVEALFTALDPRQAAIQVDYMSPVIFDRIMAETEADNSRRRQLTTALFSKLAGEHKVSVRDKPTKLPEPSASYIERTGDQGGVVVDASRLSDLVVFGLPRSTDVSLALDAALRASGRPVLLAPQVIPPGSIKTIAIAWNGSIQATRAVGFAMPLLERATNVVVLTADGEQLYGPSAKDLASALAWHGVRASSCVLTSKSKAQADALLKAAEHNSADMMVLGAYTRGEIRRLIFGGVTGQLLKSSPLPLLMAH